MTTGAGYPHIPLLSDAFGCWLEAPVVMYAVFGASDQFEKTHAEALEPNTFPIHVCLRHKFEDMSHGMQSPEYDTCLRHVWTVVKP